MSRRVYVITHPDVVVDPSIPVPRWPLSPRGLERMRKLLERAWVREVGAVWSSDEQKAIDGAVVLADHLGLAPRQREDLGENDRSSTGFLVEKEFQATADEFFARPDESVRGWERAADAQARIAGAIDAVAAGETAAAIAVVTHGGVASLLLCRLLGEPISRRNEQPGRAGGNYFCFEWPSHRLLEGWTPIDG